MAYVNYIYYSVDYAGALNEADFNRLERLACTYVNRYTFNRVALNLKGHPDFEIPAEIKNAVCHVAEYLYNSEQTNGVIASETVGKHTVSYVNNGRTTKETEIADIIKLELAGTNWTYQGGGL